MKDTGVILSLSVILSVGLLASTMGVGELVRKLSQDDAWDVIAAVIFFVGIFSLISYLLVKVAAHYFVYLAIATLFGIIFPVSRRRQRSALKEIYNNAEKRD